MKSKNYVLVFFVTIIILLVLANSTLASPKKIQIGHVTVPTDTDAYQMACVKFAELAKERTGGEIEFEIFPNSQLGDERDLIEGMQIGSVDAGLITNAPIGGFVPSFMILDMPFIFRNADCAHKTLDGKAGETLLEKLDSIGIKGLAFAEGGFRHMINNVNPINTAEDTQGIKFRVMESPIYIGMFKSLGSNAIPMPWGEVFTAVQQGVMDGLEIPMSSIYSCKLYEVTKYLSLTEHTYSPLIFMISNSVWNTLSDEHKQILKGAAKDAAVYERARLAEIENEFIKNVENEGMIVNKVDDKTSFQEAVKPMYEDFKDQIGEDILDLFMEEIAKCN